MEVSLVRIQLSYLKHFTFSSPSDLHYGGITKPKSGSPAGLEIHQTSIKIEVCARRCPLGASLWIPGSPK